MAKWFQPASPAVRAVLTGVMLASLLMAAALPDAFGDDGVLFAAKRLAVAAIVVLLAPLGPHLGALALCATVATLLSALALWELRTPARDGLLGQLRNIQQQPEGTS